MMTSRLRSYLLATLACLLAAKLMMAGVVFVSSRRASPAMAWRSAAALAEDKSEAPQKTNPPNLAKKAPSKPTVGSPDLEALQKEIAILEAQLRKISAGLDRYVRSGGEKSAISPETLEDKRRRLEKQRSELDAEREKLEALKKEIEGKLSRLTAVQTAIESKLEERKTIRDERLKHLIKIYTTMPPKKAAALIDKLEMDVVIALFSRMKGDSVGQILPYVSPERAAKISERLAKLTR